MNKKLSYYLAVVGFFVLVYNKWIFSLKNLTFGDWYFFFNETLNTSRLGYFTSWISDFSFGRVVLDMGQAPTYFFYGVLSKYLGLSYNLGERIIHFWPIIILTPLSSFILLRKYFPNKLAVIIGVLAYSFNSYFLILQLGHLTLMSAYALAPLILYFYQEGLEKRFLFKSVIAGLLFSLAAGYEPRAAYVIFWLLFFYLLFFLLINFKSFKYKKIIWYGIYGIIPFIITFLLNSYWVLALSSIGAIQSNELFDRSLYGGELYNLLYAVALFHPFWNGTEVKIFIAERILPYFWFFPLLALIGTIVQKNKKVLFFGFIALLGIFLSKQEDLPFSQFYTWMYFHFPGFNAYREASKFYFYTALGYSVLIASFFTWFYSLDFTKSWEKYFRYGLTVLTIGFLVLNTKPLITGEVGPLFKTREAPKDFIVFKDFLLKQQSYSRTLWLPATSRWSFFTPEHPEISMINLLYSEWRNYFKNTSPEQSDTLSMIDMLKDEKFNILIDQSAIKYVILSIRVKENEEDWIGTSSDRTKYLQTLNALPYLKRIDIGTKDIAVYENENVKPHLYITSQPESYNKRVSTKNIEYASKDPAEYSVHIEDVKSPFYLQFSETYHPAWNLYPLNTSWLTILGLKNSLLPQNLHTKSNAGFNSFFIDPSTLCTSSEVCTKRNDGSFDINMKLFFRPQAYFYLGSIISIATLLMAILYVVFYLTYGSKKRNK